MGENLSIRLLKVNNRIILLSIKEVFHANLKVMEHLLHDMRKVCSKPTIFCAKASPLSLTEFIKSF